MIHMKSVDVRYCLAVASSTRTERTTSSTTTETFRRYDTTDAVSWFSASTELRLLSSVVD